MATIAQERKSSGIGFGGCLVVAAIIGAVLMMVLSDMGESLDLAQSLPALNDHAIDRHGVSANVAWDHINSMPTTEFCRWKCPDGRTRYMCWMRGTNEWAVAVVSEAGALLTSFLSTQRYARKIIDDAGCTNPFHPAHP